MSGTEQQQAEGWPQKLALARDDDGAVEVVQSPEALRSYERGDFEIATYVPERKVDKLVSVLEEVLDYIDDEERVVVIEGRLALADFKEETGSDA